MLLDFQCPKCGHKFGVNEKSLDRIVIYIHCPSCNENLPVQDDLKELKTFREFLKARKQNGSTVL